MSKKKSIIKEKKITLTEDSSMVIKFRRATSRVPDPRKIFFNLGMNKGFCFGCRQLGKRYL